VKSEWLKEEFDRTVKNQAALLLKIAGMDEYAVAASEAFEAALATGAYKESGTVYLPGTEVRDTRPYITEPSLAGSKIHFTIGGVAAFQDTTPLLLELARRGLKISRNYDYPECRQRCYYGDRVTVDVFLSMDENTVCRAVPTGEMRPVMKFDCDQTGAQAAEAIAAMLEAGE